MGMRQKNGWRRCGLCGLFMSYADLDVGYTEDPTMPYFAEPADPEDFIRFHKKCYEEYELRHNDLHL